MEKTSASPHQKGLIRQPNDILKFPNLIRDASRHRGSLRILVLVRAALAELGLGILDQLHDITNLPKPVRHAGRHGGSNPQATMDPAEIVMGEMQRRCGLEVVQFLAETIAQAG